MLQSARPAFPQYGEVWDINFDPVVGSEIGKMRPALVVSNNVNNQYADTITVLPVTSRPVKKHYDFEIAVPKDVAGLKVESRIKANQIRTVDKRRLVQYRGTLPTQYLPRVANAIKIHLNMM